MQWSAYEVFSILSGIVLLGAAMLPSTSAKDRVWAGLGGAFFLGYGLYVANQTAGTYEFPVIIFIIPFIAVAYLVTSFVKQRAGQSAGDPDRQ